MEQQAAAADGGTGLRLRPYWLDDADPPGLPDIPPEAEVDVAVIGSGYTGLNAALVTARAGRTTAVFEAGTAGQGCSTRNGGQISTSIKPSLESLGRRFGRDRAQAIHAEGVRALDWIEAMVRDEAIDCAFRRAGRFHAAHTPQAYEALARLAATDPDAHAVPRAEQSREIGSDLYHGGIVQTRHAALHPARYHAGLLKRVTASGVRVHQHTPVLGVGREGRRHRLTTPKGTVTARDVVIATNGYSGGLVPWLRRRIVPIGSYVIATEPLDERLMRRLFPNGRNVVDTRRVLYYYRPSPDGRRVIFGGRVSSGESTAAATAPWLHREMTRIFPELATVGISHAWSGTVAYSFDELVHLGQHQGMHFALCYCGSGVSMASYLGMRMGHKVLDRPQGKTAFDGLPFSTRPLYAGHPWFLPAAVAWYRWRDDLDCARAARVAA